MAVQHLNALRPWRRQAGLTIEEVSGLTSLSAPFLSRLERGERRVRPLTKVRIARALGAPVGVLFPPEAPTDPQSTPATISS